MSEIIKNKSKAGSGNYQYTYSSLADFHKADVEIPQMRTVLKDGVEFVEYKDGDDWLQGARIVVTELRGMNACQSYGAALTYARRYTVALAKAIATDDDDKVEHESERQKTKTNYTKPFVEKDYGNAMATDKQKAFLKKIASEEALQALQKAFGNDLSKMDMNTAKKAIDKALGKKDEANNTKANVMAFMSVEDEIKDEEITTEDIPF